MDAKNESCRGPALPTGWKGLSSVQLDGSIPNKPCSTPEEASEHSAFPPGIEADWKEISSVQLDSLIPKAGPTAPDGPVHVPGPPALNYDWHSRRLPFALNSKSGSSTIRGDVLVFDNSLVKVGALVFFNAILPIMVFYLLLHYSDVDKIHRGDHSVLYGATTASLGTLQIPQWFWRWWDCYKKNDCFISTTHEPEKGKCAKIRSSVKRSIECWDVFQWSFLGGIIVGSITLVLGTCLNGNYGNWPLMALSPSAIFALIGVAFLIPTLLASWGMRSPVALSGHPMNSHILPALAYMWPDLVAVDGGGGVAFRQSFNHRWHASQPFRHMVTTLSWGIGLPLVLQLGPEILLVSVIEKKDSWSFIEKAQYTWGPAWGLLLTVLLSQAIWAVIYVRLSFKWEKQRWHAMYRGEMHFD